MSIEQNIIEYAQNGDLRGVEEYIKNGADTRSIQTYINVHDSDRVQH